MELWLIVDPPLLTPNAHSVSLSAPTPATPSHSPLHSAYAKSQRRKALDLNPDLSLDLDLVLPDYI